MMQDDPHLLIKVVALVATIWLIYDYHVWF